MAVGKEMGLCKCFQPAQFPDIEQELLKIDEVGVCVCVWGGGGGGGDARFSLVV